MVCAVDVVGHEGGDEDGADELCLSVYVRGYLGIRGGEDGPARREGPWKLLATPC